MLNRGSDSLYLESVYKFRLSVMPDLIRHPESLEKTGFRLEFTPVKTGAGMTPSYEKVSLWTDFI